MKRWSASLIAMTGAGAPYYIGGLSAAALHGAAHQPRKGSRGACASPPPRPPSESKGAGRRSPASSKLGLRDDARVEVLAGLREGEEVVIPAAPSR